MSNNTDIRERVNTMAGRKHELTRQILGIDWFDLNSQARRAIEYIADREENLQTRFVGEVKHKAPGHINWDDWPTNWPEGTKLYTVTEGDAVEPGGES